MLKTMGLGLNSMGFEKVRGPPGATKTIATAHNSAGIIAGLFDCHSPRSNAL